MSGQIAIGRSPSSSKGAKIHILKDTKTKLYGRDSICGLKLGDVNPTKVFARQIDEVPIVDMCRRCLKIAGLLKEVAEEDKERTKEFYIMTAPNAEEILLVDKIIHSEEELEKILKRGWEHDKGNWIRKCVITDTFVLEPETIHKLTRLP